MRALDCPWDGPVDYEHLSAAAKWQLVYAPFSKKTAGLFCCYITIGTILLGACYELDMLQIEAD